MTLRCFLTAWIVAWAVAVFLPSLLIAYFGLSQSARLIGIGFDQLLASTWEVADETGPAVKLMIGGLLLVGFFVLDRWVVAKSPSRYVASVGIGVGAMAITASLIPSAYSRGFAAALTGARFDGSVTPIYLFGGVVAGLAFVLSSQYCTRSN